MRKILDRLNKNQLKTEYWKKGKTLSQIASEFGCSWSTIRIWMSEYNLPCRIGSFKKGYIPWAKGKRLPPLSKKHRDKISEALKGKIPWNKDKKGEDNSLWGRHHTEESKQKMSDALKGHVSWCKGLTKETDDRVKKKSEKISGENSFMWGKHLIKKTREKISGENSSNWKGGITPLTKRIRQCFLYRQWRSDVFTRDDFTCQKCGDSRGGNLNAHHVIAFADIIELNDITTYEQAMNCEELWNINNGITLCKKCHLDERE